MSEPTEGTNHQFDETQTYDKKKKWGSGGTTKVMDPKPFPQRECPHCFEHFVGDGPLCPIHPKEKSDE